MANLAFQVTGNAFQGIGQFAFQGSTDSQVVAQGGGGALWAKGRGALDLSRRRTRPLTYSETEELRERLQAIAAAKALEAIPMDRIADDGHVIGDDPTDDDLLLQAMILKVLH